MPWKESRILDQRLQFLSSYQKEEMSVADLCREYGVSRPTGYRWINRYNETGPEGLVDRSCRPHSCSQAPLEPIENRIFALRAKHPSWGARKLKARLEMLQPDVVHPDIHYLKHSSLPPERRLEHEPAGRGSHPLPRVLLYGTDLRSEATPMARVQEQRGSRRSAFLLGIASVKEASPTRRANAKIKRISSKKLSGAFILTCLCTAKYKARVIYKTRRAKAFWPLIKGRRLRRPLCFQNEVGWHSSPSPGFSFY